LLLFHRLRFFFKVFSFLFSCIFVVEGAQQLINRLLHSTELLLSVYLFDEIIKLDADDI